MAPFIGCRGGGDGGAAVVTWRGVRSAFNGDGAGRGAVEAMARSGCEDGHAEGGGVGVKDVVEHVERADVERSDASGEAGRAACVRGQRRGRHRAVLLLAACARGWGRER